MKEEFPQDPDAILSLLDSWLEADWLRALDVAFAGYYTSEPLQEVKPYRLCCCWQPLLLHTRSGVVMFAFISASWRRRILTRY